MGKVIDALFGCWHLHYSFPITLKPGSSPQQSGNAHRDVRSLSRVRQGIPLRLARDESRFRHSQACQRVRSLATKEAG